IDGAFLHEAPSGGGEFIAGTDSERLAAEGRELLVARHEILFVAPLEQIAIEVGAVLGVVAIARLEDPFLSQRMSVPQLEGIGADTPGIGKEAITAVQGSAVGQEIASIQRHRVAGSSARINLRIEREQSLVAWIDIAVRAIRIVEVALV